MKKKYYLWLCLSAVAALVLYACVKEYLDTEPSGKVSGSEILSVEEAKAFFEKSTSQQVTRSGEKATYGGVFNPGDVTPQWGRAKTVANDKTGSVNVPIVATIRHGALRTEMKNGKPVAGIVTVYQQTVVLKDAQSGAMCTYLLNLVPTLSFHRGHKNYDVNSFGNNGNGNFSGLAAYYTLDGRLIRLDEYNQGQLKKSVVTLVDRESAKKTVAAMIQGIEIASRPNVQTRSGDEDDWSWDWDDFFDWLDSFFDNPFESDHFYWDTTMGEPPWSPDYEETEHDYTQGGQWSDGGSGGGGSSSGDSDNGGYEEGDSHYKKTDKQGPTIYVQVIQFDGYYKEYYWTDTDGDGVPDKCIGSMTYIDPVYVPGHSNNNSNGETGEETGSTTNNNSGDGGGSGTTGGTSGGSNSGGQNPPKNSNVNATVPNGQCVLGSVAAAIQAKTGCSAAEALQKAAVALVNNGIFPYPPILAPGTTTIPQNGVNTTSPVNPNPGVPASNQQIVNTMKELGFTVDPGLTTSQSSINTTTTNFSNGGWGMGNISGTGNNPNHEVFITGYDATTQTFQYYDSVLPAGSNYGTIPAGSIDVFLIK